MTFEEWRSTRPFVAIAQDKHLGLVPLSVRTALSHRSVIDIGLPNGTFRCVCVACGQMWNEGAQYLRACDGWL